MTHRLPASLKILHMLDHSVPMHSGYSFRTLAILREQRRRGWETVHVTSPKHTEPGPEVETVEGLTFYRTAKAAGFGARLPGIGEVLLIRKTAECIREVARIEKPHLLHAHSPALNGMAALMAAKDLRLPVVYEVRAFWEDAAVSNGTTGEGSVRYRLTRALETQVLKDCAAATAICQGLKDDIVLRGISSEKLTLIPNAIDLAAFSVLDRAKVSAAAGTLRERLQLGGKTVLGFLGSFYPYEGLDLLIAALPDLRQRAPNIALLLVGGGQCEADLHAQAKALGVEDLVCFVGRVPQSEILAYYELVDLFVFPRRKSRLTDTVTPLKPLEAMATGGIVAASDVGGHREFVGEGAPLALFEPGSASAIAGAVERLLMRSNEWASLRSAGRTYVEAKRSWAACAQGYESAYARALGERPGERG